MATKKKVKTKIKNHSGASKRFKMTGSGRVKYKHINKRHLLRKRSTKRKRHLNIDNIVKMTEQARMLRLLGQKATRVVRARKKEVA